MKEPHPERYLQISRDRYVDEVLPRLALPPILADLADYTSLSREEILKRAASWETEKERDWSAARERASSPRDFYAASECYLYAHAGADRARYSRYHQLVKPYARGRCALDYGAGIGCIGFFLHLLDGFEVTLADYDSPQFTFAAFRAKRSAPAVVLHRLDDGVPRGRFDTVVCLSTLEHIPEWRETLSTLARLMSLEGRMILKVDYDATRAVDHVAVSFGLSHESFAAAAKELGLTTVEHRIFDDDARLYVMEAR